jgi:hypothetical protein
MEIDLQRIIQNREQSEGVQAMSKHIADFPTFLRDAPHINPVRPKFVTVLSESYCFKC